MILNFEEDLQLTARLPSTGQTHQQCHEELNTAGWLILGTLLNSNWKKDRLVV
jgi:hypothetical protein